MRTADLASDQTSTAFLGMDGTSHTMAKPSSKCSSLPELLTFCGYAQRCPGISFPIRKFFTVFPVGDHMQTAFLDLLVRMQQLQQTIVTRDKLKCTRETIMICLHVCTLISIEIVRVLIILGCYK